MPAIYPHLLDPKKYQDYSRRYVKVPAWKTFGNRTEFFVLRVFSQKDGKLLNYKEDIDLYTKELKLGNVIWPFFETLSAKNFKDLVDEVKRRGLYLFDFWGHVPGSSTEKHAWGHVTPPAGTVEYMEKVMGDHFLGIDNGEQDGRYIGGYAPQMCPASSNRKKEYLNFQRHFERMGGELGNKLTALVSLTYGHYFLKEGNTLLIGAETAQGLINSQIYYAFLRGAGKQYGVLWFANASVYNRKGYKTYAPSPLENCGMNGKPEWGTSLMLLKRLIYTHILYNSAIVGFENGWILGENVDGRIAHLPVPMDTDPATRVLTPIGEIQAAAKRFVDQHGCPGVMHTPVCMMLDFHSGWTVPRHLYTSKLYQAWGGMPYSAGDYLGHNVFSMLYPGYEDSSYYADERGFLSPTPYGDIAEVMLSDADGRLLSMYGTLVLAGEIEVSEELRIKLEKYVENGGRLVITSGSLLKFGQGIAGLRIAGENSLAFRSGTEVTLGKTKLKENTPFALNKLSPAGLKAVKVVANCGKTPAVVKARHGAGEIILFLTPFGIGGEMTTEGKSISIDGAALEASLPNPYPLLCHVRHILDTIFTDEKIFDLDGNLGYITCRKKPGLYTVGVYNNRLRESPFKIKSRAGKIESTRELPVDCSEKDRRGYCPTGHEGTDTGKNTETTIAGGDIRIFEVRIKERGIREIAPMAEMPPPVNRLLALRGIRMIKEEILGRPTFFQHFNGVKVDWDYFRDKDKSALEAEREWLKIQKVKIVADFSKSLNFYPDLTILDNIEWRWKDSLKGMLGVFDKMAVLGAKDAVFSLHRKPENHFSDEQSSESFLKNIKRLCGEAAKRKIVIHLQRHPDKWHAKHEDMSSFISSVKAANLKYCLNTCHSLMASEDMVKTVKAMGRLCSMVLVSAPENDFLGQKYDTHSPVAGGRHEKGVRDLLTKLSKRMVLVLDAEYDSQDAEFRDVMMLEKNHGFKSQWQESE